MSNADNEQSWPQREDDDNYPLPKDCTPEELIKSCLKTWRDPSRISLTSRIEQATGPALPLRTAFLLDVSRLVATLPRMQRRAITLYFMIERPAWPGDHIGTDCTWSCQQHYGNREVAREMRLRGAGAAPSLAVGQYKRAGVARIVAALWPEYVAEQAAQAERDRALRDGIEWD